MIRPIDPRSLWLLAAYSAYLFVPLVHRIVEASEGPSEQSAAAVQDEWVLLADCDGPCSDPTHHHHQRGHDSRHCIVCHSHFGLHATSAVTSLTSVDENAAGLVTPNEAALPTANPSAVDSIRAPPHAGFPA